MKKLLILFTILLGYNTITAQTPNTNEWLRQQRTQRRYLVQQIAALKVYLEYLKKGYEIADKGLTAIGDIKDGTFSLDKDYFNSLKHVSPVVRNSPLVKEILVSRQHILRDFSKLYEDCRDDENFTDAEIRYIRSVYDNMRSGCNDVIDELTLITTSGETEMKDDVRLLRLDKVHGEMKDRYAFTQDFCNSTRLLSRQRTKERNELRAREKLHRFGEL